MPNLKALLAPRSMAVVGASGDISKWGGSALRNILDGGYTGTIYPVNPKGGEFFGLQAYTSLDELPEAPDLALLAVGGHQVAPMLRAVRAQGHPGRHRHRGRLLRDRRERAPRPSARSPGSPPRAGSPSWAPTAWG